jgi:hypothetical protein
MKLMARTKGIASSDDRSLLFSYVKRATWLVGRVNIGITDEGQST